AALVGRGSRPGLRRLRPLLPSAVVVSALAALGGTVQAVRWGSGLDSSPVRGGDAGVFLLGTGVSAVAALAMIGAARMLRSPASGARGILSRVPACRLAVPAALAFAIGVWPAIARDWFVIWGMWVLMLGW